MGTRPASVPAASNAVPLHVRHARRTQSARLCADQGSGARVMTETTSAPATTESVEEFAARARAWLAGNMPRIDLANPPEADRGEDAPWQRARELQKLLHDGGF